MDNTSALDLSMLLWKLYNCYMLYRMTTLITSSVLLNNSSIPETRGTVNGIGYALASLLRAVGYALAAIVFAWSQNNGEYLFQYLSERYISFHVR